MSQSPLITRKDEFPIAWLARPISPEHPLPEPGLAIGRAVFLHHVQQLAEQLPPQRYLINLCSNRYLFLVALCAGLLRQRVTLLPPTRLPTAQEQLASDYIDTLLIHDGSSTLSASQPSLNISNLDFELTPDVSAQDTKVPLIDDAQTALICFTSGSTDKPKPVQKYWRTLRESSVINYRYMVKSSDARGVYHYASVPCFHMWGLETTVFLPLFTNVCTVDANAELPADIFDHLSRLPQPVNYVGTPLHLRALHTIAKGRSTNPSPSRVLCATAPLDARLAKAIESQFNTEVTEIYGCSEAGSMAARRTASENHWTSFAELSFSSQPNNRVSVDADHLPEPVLLEDTLKLKENGTFLLSGRATDMVKVGGKRGSLNEINRTLLRYEGISDGVVFTTEHDNANTRLAAMVVARENTSRAALLNYLREHLDPVFLPRPVYFVDKLPRSESGKLPRKKLLDFLNQHKA